MQEKNPVCECQNRRRYLPVSTGAAKEENVQTSKGNPFPSSTLCDGGGLAINSLLSARLCPFDRYGFTPISDVLRSFCVLLAVVAR
jgi:hypothetical protein